MSIVITAKRDGFRRCGVAHPKEPTEYPDDRFSVQELKILQAEPMLVVEQGKEKKQPPAPPSRPNVQETVKLVEAASTLEELDKLAEGEDRKGVLAALDARRKELTPAE